MAFDIDSGMVRDITLTYTAADGTPEIQGEPVLTISPEGAANVTITQPFDPSNGTVMVLFAHNGTVVEGEGVMFTATADGDLGEGVHPIIASEFFVMKAPLGATGVALGVSEQRPA